MEDRLVVLADSIAALGRRVGALEERLAAVEARAAEGVAPAPTDGGSPVQPAAGWRSASDSVLVLSSVGRSLIVLGGAYLLRALTEGGALPPVVGSMLALAYALIWVLAAGRSAARGRQVDAAFHGLTASLIGFPLIWEATVRFGFLSAGTSALALALFTGTALVVAWRTQQRVLAWSATLAALATSAALVPQMGAPVPFAAFLMALGVATLWFGYVHDWTLLRWPVAAAADVMAAGLIARGLSQTRPDPPSVVLALLLALMAGYLASTAVRTLIRGRNVIPFEVVQTGAALLLGLWGSVLVARAAGAGTTWFGLGVLLLGVASYAVAFAFVDKRQGRGRNFYFYTSLAVVFTLAGVHLVLGKASLPLVASALGIASGILGVRFGRLALGLHAALYLVVAAVSSGLIDATSAALTGEATSRLPAASALVTLAALAFAVALPLRCQSDEAAGWARPHRLAVLTLFLCGIGGLAVSLADMGLASALGRLVTPAEAATVRTVVFAASALGLALAGSRLSYLEAGWLTYPVLLIGGLKVLQDLRSLPASLLVVSLATYGAALIVAPRTLRWRRQPPDTGGPSFPAAVGPGRPGGLSA